MKSPLETGENQYLLDNLLQDCDISRTRILITACELDLFTELEKQPKSSKELAQSMNLDESLTKRLLCALIEMNYVASNINGIYSNSKVSSLFLNRKSSCSICSWLCLHAGDWNSWGQLTQKIQNGLNPHRRNIFSDPNRTLGLVKACHESALLFHVLPFLELIDFSTVNKLLDLGSGAGTYSIALAQKWQKLTVTLFDCKEAILFAQSLETHKELKDRIEYIQGDYNKDELKGKYDAVLLSQVISCEDIESLDCLFQKINSVLTRNGMLIIRDFFLDESGTSPQGGAIFSLTVMIETEKGMTYKLSDLLSLLEKNGFCNHKLLDNNVLIVYKQDLK